MSVKCSNGHTLKTIKQSIHKPKPTKHDCVFVLTCNAHDCETSVHAFIQDGMNVERQPTKKEMLIAYGFEQARSNKKNS